MLFFDPLYLIMIAPVIILTIYAQVKVKRAFSKYKKIGVRSGLTGAQAAHEMLAAARLERAVKIQKTGGFLSDHYDPRNKVLRLSPDVYHGKSISAIGVACHEAGHAIQHAKKYGFLTIRNAIVPMASVGSWLSWPLIIIGVIFQMFELIFVGVIAFSVIVLFQIINLPVELDASKRAKAMAAKLNLVQTNREADGIAAVLNAAAFTYIAATLTAIVQLLYFLLRLGFLGGDD